MQLYLDSYVENLLKKASYEYGEETKSWCGSIDELPGVYAQADSIEEVREQLAEMIEDYVYVTLSEKQKLAGFKKFGTKINDSRATA